MKEKTQNSQPQKSQFLQDNKIAINGFVYIVLALLCLTPYIKAPIALFLGIVFALVIGNPFPKFNKFSSKYLLQVSVVGLGFGMNLIESLKSGSDGMLFTLFSVVSVMFLGMLIGKKLGMDKVPSYLIASGTAICGGSAIAAVGPTAKAKGSDMSVALATIFVLNAVALFLFPVLGHFFNLSQHQFGVWAAIAIHDTSSVVGAGSTYGEEALKVATTVKLTRALWIIPLSVFTTFYFKSKGEKIYIPWFIFLFILAMVMNTYLSLPEQITGGIVIIARQSLTLTLFFIGAGLTKSTIQSVGIKPFILGIILWFFIALISLAFIYSFY